MISFILMKLKNYKAMVPVMLIMTAMTLVFIYVFGIGFSQAYKPKVVLVDKDKTMMSQAIIERLKDNKNYTFSEELIDEGLKQLEAKQIMGVVLIDAGFEEKLANQESEVVFYKFGEAIEHVALQNFLSALVTEVIQDKGFSAGLSGFLKTQEIAVSSDEIYNKVVENQKEFVTYNQEALFYQKDNAGAFNMIKHYFSGFMLFFSMFIIMFGIGNIVEEKENHVWHRQLVSPLSSKVIMTGNLASNFLIGMAQLLFVVVVSRLIFGIEWGGSTVAILLVLGAYVIAGTAMGLFIVNFVKTQQQLAAALPTIIVASSMIGGCMWPLEMMQSKFLLTLANFLPQRWGMEGLSQVIIYNGGIQDVLKPILYLLIIATVFLAASIIPSKKAV